ncbi:DnaJ sub C member 24 [Coemansia sp. RSA 1813]|nr:DnaJ sub C member 24 [Coemansia sp. RSA 1646]KAJ1772530.1 DnaJ sub C member 24 [Coemansia sp. RSA 1843]KAJ2090933.1 DnaJ sub C member 24 [Coemansia sp. RSA 986]KAJ2213999.1 DnaJ sub C member 24 [Coemansia sp. RSA 487]KAJ2571240.1 DnaJ sub C member 24 [Coemansia sp. RSA 1813]
MCDTYPDHYAVLGIHNTATREEIKRAYYTLSRQVHPDKSQRINTSDTEKSMDISSENTGVKFHELSTAWAVLGDVIRRREYDMQRSTQKSKARGVVQDEVDLDDMDFNESTGVFSFPCRCSAHYEISEDDLEEGREIAPCSGCSLKVKVMYDVVED